MHITPIAEGLADFWTLVRLTARALVLRQMLQSPGLRRVVEANDPTEESDNTE